MFGVNPPLQQIPVMLSLHPCHSVTAVPVGGGILPLHRPFLRAGDLLQWRVAGGAGVRVSGLHMLSLSSVALQSQSCHQSSWP